MERPRFRAEVCWKRQTFFGATSQMKRSQWATLSLPDIATGNGSHNRLQPGTSSAIPSRSSGQSCSLPVLNEMTAESLPQVLSKHDILDSVRSMTGLAATEPLPQKGMWMQARWGAGSQKFGAPPLAKLNGRMLKVRIAHLEGGVAKARSEVHRLSREVLEDCTQYRGFVMAEQRNLEQELSLCQAEWGRRKQAQDGSGRSVKRIRCIAVPEQPAVVSPSTSPVSDQQVALAYSASEPALKKAILKQAL